MAIRFFRTMLPQMEDAMERIQKIYDHEKTDQGDRPEFCHGSCFAYQCFPHVLFRNGNTAQLPLNNFPVFC